MRARFTTVLLSLALPCIVGCATYSPGYVFHALSGHGASVRASEGEVGRVHAAVLGLRNAGNAGVVIDVRIRVERFGTAAITVTAEDLRLVTGGAEALVASSVRAVGPEVPASGGAATFEATFPLSGHLARVFDLGDIDLVVALDVAGRPEVVTLGFERTAAVYLWGELSLWSARDFTGNRTGWRR